MLGEPEASIARRVDTLAVEEPLEIRVSGQPFTVIMRTPGNDVELATGFLAGEGVITEVGDVLAAIHCASDDGENTYNVLDMTLSRTAAATAAGLTRNFATTSSCGVCGTASIEQLERMSRFDIRSDDTVVGAALLGGFPAALRASQPVFEKTGGLHAAGLFDAATGELLAVREDIGRHNAVDKVIGWAMQQGRLPLGGTVLQVSGRASFEIVQKAYLAGIPILSAVSAPSSLAVELAASIGMTLVGFVRGGSMNVYSGSQRVDVTSHERVSPVTSQRIS